MFLDRRSLLQSAAALLVPPMAAIPPWGKTENRQLESAVDRYFDAFKAYFGKPYRPDDNTEDAHDRCTEDVEKRKDVWEVARKELMRLVMAHHGLDGEKEASPLAALTVDVGELTVVVGPHTEPDSDSDPYGWDTLVFVPRTAAMRAKLNAIRTFNPTEWASKEDEERLGYKEHEPPPVPEVDLSRMPAGEPMPLTAALSKSCYGSASGETTITRTWTPEGALACRRCLGCTFWQHSLEDLKGARIACEVTVDDEDVERVLYSPTPKDTDNDHHGDVMISTLWNSNINGPGIIELITTSKAEWEAGGYADSERGRWHISDRDRGTRGNMVVALRYRPGPIPMVIEWDTPARSAPLA